MPYATMEDRVDRLEALFGQFLTQIAVLKRHGDDRDRVVEEWHRAAEERMARFQAEARADRREMNRRRGELANKLGTLIEDVLAPNLRRLARDHFRFSEIEEFAMRWSRRRPGGSGGETEFDTIVVGPEAVILGEATSMPTLDSVHAFAAKAGMFFEYFPEFAGRRRLPVLAGWAMPGPIVDALTERQIYAMRMGEDTMELANAAALEGTAAK